MLIRGRTSRLPGHNEVRYIHGGVASPPPPPQSKIHHQLYSVCLVTVHVSCLDTETANLPRAPVVCLVTVPVSCLDTAPVVCLVTVPAVSCLDTAPVVCLVTVPVSCVDTAPVVCLVTVPLVIGHSSRAGGGNPPRTPPSSTGCLLSHSTWFRAWTQQPCRGGGNPPQPPPSSTPPGAGSQIYLLIFNNDGCCLFFRSTWTK